MKQHCPRLLQVARRRAHMQASEVDGYQKKRALAQKVDGSLGNDCASTLLELFSLHGSCEGPTDRTRTGTAKRGGGGRAAAASSPTTWSMVHVPPAFETLPAHPIRGASPPQFCVIFSVAHHLVDISTRETLRLRFLPAVLPMPGTCGMDPGWTVDGCRRDSTGSSLPSWLLPLADAGVSECSGQSCIVHVFLGAPYSTSF